MSASITSLDKTPPPERFHYDADARKGRRINRSISEILTIVCAGFALISDGYQICIMNMMNAVFARLYPKEYTNDVKTSVSNASLVGTIFGQVIIGVLADRLNRKQSIVIATAFLVFGTILCAASHGLTVNGMFWMLIIFRGVTGFGIGAEYPSCSVSANEAANETFKRRGGIFVLVTNLPLALGGPFASIIFLIVWQITGLSNTLWRTLFAIGAFWPLSVFYFRYKMATSELFKKSAIRKNVPYWLALKYYWKRLLGSCLCWFIYDFVVVPNYVFSATIISSVLPAHQRHDLEKIAEWQLLLSAIAIPGVLIGAAICDKLGRRNTMIVGFVGYIIFGLVIGLAYEKVTNITALFILFYGLIMCMGNLGPGNMTVLVASESFATPIRGTFYGISAAMGKIGAVVGTKSFSPIQVQLGKNWTFIIAAIFGVAGILSSWFFVPQLKDDDMLEEDVRFKNYLISSGWAGTFGTDDGLVVSTSITDEEDLVEENYQKVEKN